MKTVYLRVDFEFYFCYTVKNTPSLRRQHIMKYPNPILEGYADPDILHENGKYYFYATSYHTKCGYELLVSNDLITWGNRGMALDCAWGFGDWYWAPDVKKVNGRYYMLASVREHLGIAVADSPEGPFIPEKEPLFDKTIDGHIFCDDDGRIYIYYVTWRENHRYGLYCMEMTSDFEPIYESERAIIFAEEPWESHQAKVAEAPYMIKKDGIYYLTYSGSHYESKLYAVGYAVSTSPMGPFEKYGGNPILVGDGEKICGTGHHCITDDGHGNMLIVYHTHKDSSRIHPRCISVGTIRFEKDADGKVILACTL